MVFSVRSGPNAVQLYIITLCRAVTDDKVSSINLPLEEKLMMQHLGIFLMHFVYLYIYTSSATEVITINEEEIFYFRELRQILVPRLLGATLPSPEH